MHSFSKCVYGISNACRLLVQALQTKQRHEVLYPHTTYRLTGKGANANIKRSSDSSNRLVEGGAY